MKYAIRKGQYDPVDRAAMNRNAPVAYRPKPIRIPLLYENRRMKMAAGRAIAKYPP